MLIKSQTVCRKGMFCAKLEANNLGNDILFVLIIRLRRFGRYFNLTVLESVLLENSWVCEFHNIILKTFEP